MGRVSCSLEPYLKHVIFPTIFRFPHVSTRHHRVGGADLFRRNSSEQSSKTVTLHSLIPLFSLTVNYAKTWGEEKRKLRAEIRANS